MKEQLKAIAERLDERATWDDVMYEIHVRKMIDMGLAAVANGHTASHGRVKGMFPR
ncbi:MAG: hypothetical protein QNK37_25435 [Acidobacteriota bacterium]|nr:hypothetical protein [Acidobacteriota bacterium]